MIEALVSSHRGTTRESRTVPSHFVGCLEPENSPEQRQCQVVPALAFGVA